MTEPDANEIPSSIGAYEVIDQIGAGGMATVYKARHRDSGAVVAIKVCVPNSTADDGTMLQRFQQEIRVTSGLRHPHLVRGLDFGTVGDRPYLVMEYVDGPSMGERIEQDGRLREAEAVRYVAQIGLALHEAHQQGVIHRDVKPDNILITADGRAKLTDLGLVKQIDLDLDLTRPARGLGTPNFMAPEQFNDAKNADPRCDVYSLGATLYMAVTGVLPFQARGTLSIFRKKVNNELELPRKLAPDLSARTEWVIRKSVRADPTHRFASCLEVVRALTDPAAMTDGEAPAPGAGVPVTLDDRADRRGAERHATNLFSACQPIGGTYEYWPATVKDISTTGLSLLVNRRFEPGTVLAVDLQGVEAALACTWLVRVVRVVARPGGAWMAGCRFGCKLGDEEVRALL